MFWWWIIFDDVILFKEMLYITIKYPILFQPLSNRDYAEVYLWPQIVFTRYLDYKINITKNTIISSLWEREKVQEAQSWY